MNFYEWWEKFGKKFGGDGIDGYEMAREAWQAGYDEGWKDGLDDQESNS